LDVLYHSGVPWLSLGKVLRRVWELKEEIVMFLEMKSIQCDFSTNIVDEEWRLDFKLAIDIMEKFNELNIKLQGNGIFTHEMYVHVKSFQMNLSLLSRQAGYNRFCNFPLLKEANISSELAAKHKVQLDTFGCRIRQKFKNLESHFNILSSPFTTEVDSAPEDIQLELLDLQANNDLKEKFKSDSLPDFYKPLSDNLFPNLKNFLRSF